MIHFRRFLLISVTLTSLAPFARAKSGGADRDERKVSVPESYLEELAAAARGTKVAAQIFDNSTRRWKTLPGVDFTIESWSLREDRTIDASPFPHHAGWDRASVNLEGTWSNDGSRALRVRPEGFTLAKGRGQVKVGNAWNMDNISDLLHNADGRRAAVDTLARGQELKVDYSGSIQQLSNEFRAMSEVPGRMLLRFGPALGQLVLPAARFILIR